ncbi:MAG: hypothetical protein IKI72_08365 [Bacteroidales bacterium]|nr:hypothetical protein [Bacteroidales bacterium]
MNKFCLILLSVLTGLCSCSVIDSDSARTKPDFGQRNISLGFDNRKQYQDTWQAYINSCSESLLAIGTAHAERGSKAHPDGLSPFYDALLNHPSEISVHVIPVYMVSYADYQQAAAEARLTDVARLDTSRIRGLFVFKNEVIGACKAKVSRSELSVKSWSDMTQKAYHNESLSDNAEGKYLAYMLEQGKNIFYLNTVTDTASSTNFWPSGYGDICFAQKDQIMFIRWNELLNKVETGDMQDFFKLRLAQRNDGLIH